MNFHVFMLAIVCLGLWILRHFNFNLSRTTLWSRWIVARLDDVFDCAAWTSHLTARKLEWGHLMCTVLDHFLRHSEISLPQWQTNIDLKQSTCGKICLVWVLIQVVFSCSYVFPSSSMGQTARRLPRSKFPTKEQLLDGALGHSLNQCQGGQSGSITETGPLRGPRYIVL